MDLTNLYSHSFLDPEKVIKNLDVQPGETVLDFAAGAGYWAIPFAKKVGRGGHVFITDPKEGNLEIIRNKAKVNHLENITYIKAPYNSTTIPVQTKVDLILFSNIFSMTETDNHLIASCKRLSKKGTKLIIIDWKLDAEIGPRKKDRILVGELILEAQNVGFQFKKLLDVGTYHIGLYFEYVG